MNRWACIFIGGIALGQAPVEQPSVPDDKVLAVLAGTVVNGLTKEPVRKASVILELADGNRNSALVSTTAESGLFRFIGVQPGRYNLKVEKQGFIAGVYRALKPGDEGSQLSVAGGARMEDLTLRLFPGGTITGHVLDADGDPFPIENVQLWSAERKDSSVKDVREGQAKASPTGEYRFVGLAAGSYYLSVSPERSAELPVDSTGKVTKLRALTTFYPAAVSSDDAQPVRVGLGQEQSGIDIRVQRGLTMSVKGHVEGVGGSAAKYTVSARLDSGGGWTSTASAVLPNGDFLLKDLPPGKHPVGLLETGENGSQLVGKTEVYLTDKDLTGVTITPFRPGEAHVRVVADGEPLTAGSVYLRSMEGEEILYEYGAENNAYFFHAIAPGKYEIGFTNADCCYLKSLQSGDQTLESESVDIAAGAVLDLQLTYSREVASLTGDVEASEDQTDSSAQVLLVARDSRLNKLKYASVDQSLHFAVAKVRPTKYLVFAAQDDDFNLWSNVEFVKAIESEGTEIELHEKEHADVHLKLITKDETDGIRKRLGL